MARTEKPAATGSDHPLPFDQLSPPDFERMCLWLLQSEGWQRIDHYGAAGSDGGRDLVAYRNRDDDRPYVFQCKRRPKVSSRELQDEIDLIAAATDPPPRAVIFVVAGRVSANVRDRINAHAEGYSFNCEFWASTELDAKVRQHWEIVDSFFQLPARSSPAIATLPEAPRRIPDPPFKFVNRKSDFRKLDRATRLTRNTQAPKVAILHGLHGVGKSAFGRQWSAIHRKQFTAGDLFANFSRRDKSTSIEVSDVIAQFLRDLGVEKASIPAAYGPRVELFRNITRGLRLLIFLDDVEHAAQVKASIPSGAGSVVVVTSHYRMEELYREGAESVDLQPFNPIEARQLLVRMVGASRIRREPQAVDKLVDRCGGLPIALCLCAGRLVSEEARTVEWLVRQIDHAPNTLAALTDFAPDSIGAVFDFTYGDLDPSTAKVYRRLGAFPGVTFSTAVAAQLAEMSIRDTQRALDDLHQAHLVDLSESDRFRLHDLVRIHAAACNQADKSDLNRDRGVAALVDWYCAALQKADRAIVADRIRLSDDVVIDSDDVPDFDSPTAAFQWFGLERVNINGVLQLAFDRGWDSRVWQIAEALWPLCASHKYFAEWIRSHELAIESALRLNDKAVEARFRSQLARAYSEQSEHDKAATQMAGAHRAAQQCGDERLMASVTEFGGVCLLRAGRYQAALEEFRGARAQFLDLRVSRGVALQDLYIGWALVELDQPAVALDHLAAALDALKTADEVSVGRILVQRGKALVLLSRYPEATAELEAAIVIMKRLGIRYEQALAYEALAQAANADRQPAESMSFLRAAHDLYRQLGHARADQIHLMIGDLEARPASGTA